MLAPFRWLAIVLAVILAFGMHAYRQQAVPETIICGTSVGGTDETARYLKGFRAVGQAVDKWSDPDMLNDLDQRVEFYLRGLAKDVLWYWFKAAWQDARGEKIDPQILKLERDAAKADAEANDMCTPCPPGSDVPDQPGGGQPEGPPVDSISISRGPSSPGADAARVAASRYWSGRNLDIAVAIAGAESGWKPGARSPANSDGTYDHGEWQINSVHRALLAKGDWRDINMNAWMAYQVYREDGNRWTPWTTYKSGAYRKFMRPAPRTPQGPTARVEVPLFENGAAPSVVCQSPEQQQSDARNGFGIIDTRVVWPAPSRQHGDGYPGHTGVDFNGPQNATGAPISAAAAGVVDYTGTGRGYGSAIFIKTDTGYTTIYGHTSRIDVKPGQRVSPGQRIGAIGYSGNVRPAGPEGAHLHFEVRPGATQKAALTFLAGNAPNLNRGAVAASTRGARKVTDPTTGVTYSVPIPAGPHGVALNFALDQLGDPYKFGAHGPDRWDCSGLTAGAWAAAGYRITPQSEVQRATVPLVSEPRPGDILWQRGHVQMYVGKVGGKTLVVEAPRPGMRVIIRQQWMRPRAVLDPSRLGAKA
jgi:murein DD-endopeptidase MepM/ murein hydrolase activator NlpD